MIKKSYETPSVEMEEMELCEVIALSGEGGSIDPAYEDEYGNF
ncbi:MAG: hypothetical protein ACI399_05595 [Candidatus Cryptobacteroides sp.]